VTLRRKLLLSSLAAALVLSAAATAGVEWLRAADRRVALERASAAAVVQHQREVCEANPNWFLAGPREGRPTKEQMAAPDADVNLQRPDTKPRPFEYFAYDEEFRGVSTAAPRFPPELRLALKSGDAVASQNWSSPSGLGVETARLTRWTSSECAVLLFRAEPPPGQMRQRASMFGIFALAVFVTMFAAGLPVERRIAAVTDAIRASSRSDYSVLAPVSGKDAVSAASILFNEAAAEIRQRNAEVKEQREALRRITADTAADLVEPLGAVPARIGDVLKSVSVTPAVREQMQAALRDSHTVAHRGANLVASTTLRDRDLVMKQEPVDLTALVARVVESEVMFAHSSGVPLTAAIPDRPVKITGDAALLELALVNVIDNAIRYNRPGGRVSVDLTSSGDGHFVLLVSDDGAGVTDAELKYFNGIRRFRGDERRRHRQDEVGLGLAIVHEVTGRHKMALAFRRRDNGGLEVKISA
jgi:signal transduction histidine kinase